jgi:hypothetical protein
MEYTIQNQEYQVSERIKKNHRRDIKYTQIQIILIDEDALPSFHPFRIYRFAQSV